MPSLTRALTRAEAAERAATIQVGAYEIDLDLTDPAGSFSSRTIVRFTAQAGGSTGASVFADLEAIELVSATLNGAPLGPGALDGHRLLLDDLAATNELVVEARMAYANDGEGLHRFVDPNDGRTYLWGQMFLDKARRVFACFDQPDLKAPFTVRVTAPPEWVVASNAAPVGQAVDGRWEFATTVPLATYFVTVIAGPWHVRTDEHRGIPLAVYARQELARHLDDEADEIFTVTKQCMDRYAELFRIPYPFGIYGQAFVPEFNAGAMENPGLVTFRDEFVFRGAVTDAERELRAMVIAHEMAHMWFGDLVTMTWWDDLWLNESFAEYMGHRVTAEATRFAGAWTTFAVRRKSWGVRADQKPSTHPVAPSDVTDTDLALLNFDGISYAKGASVLKQLVAWIGEEAFIAGVNEHFDSHRFGNATLADLLSVLARTGGRDLSAWSEAWLRRPELNTLRPEVTVAGDGTYAEVAILQSAPERHPTLRPHRLALGLYDHGADGVVTRRELVELDISAAERTVVPGLAGAKPADLLLVNDGDLTYAKIRLDDTSLANVPMILPLLGDSLSRAVVWAALLDAVADGERPVAELVTLVLAALPMETEVAIVEDVLSMARRLVDRCSTPETRPAALELTAQAGDRLLAASSAGGSRQLAAARGLVGATTDTVRLRGWLNGEGVPEGLPIDAEMRWLILYRLVVLGAAEAAEIEAEFERDHTTAGEHFAARCRAALPDAAAKERAWTTIIADAGTSARLAEAMAMGFWQPEQAALTEPYVARYFADMPSMLEVRSGTGAERIAVVAYPRYAVATETRRLAADLLAQPEVSPTLRRTVMDEDDDIRRALDARG